MAGKQRRGGVALDNRGSDDSDWCRPSKKAKLSRSSTVSGEMTMEQESKTKELHSQVEKRRRDKLVFYINELAGAIPMVTSTAVKPDKLFILKQTVNHMRALRDGDPQPSMFLSDPEECSMLLEATGGFSFTLQCSSCKLVEVSSSVYDVLGFTKGSMQSQHLFDFIHRDDMRVVEEQLTAPPLSSFAEESQEEQDDLCKDTPTPQAPPSPLQRRFYCRMLRSNLQAWLTSGASNSKDLPKDSFILCKVTGYFRLSPTDDVEFVAMVSCVSLPLEDKKMKDDLSPSYTARCDMSGTFTYVENCVEELLGYSAKELLGKSAYQFVHPDDVVRIMSFHKKLLGSTSQMQSPRFRIRTNFCCWFWCQMTCTLVRNPWSKDVEFFVARTDIIQGMAPIPMRQASSPLQLPVDYMASSSSSMFPQFFPMEFDGQGALADLLALTDTAVRPFTQTPAAQQPPALTPDPLNSYMYQQKLQSSPDWSTISNFSRSSGESSSNSDPMSFPWTPPLM